MAVFLDLHGWRLEAPEAEVVQVMLAVASGELDEASLAAWVRGHVQAPAAVAVYQLASTRERTAARLSAVHCAGSGQVTVTLTPAGRSK